MLNIRHIGTNVAAVVLCAGLLGLPLAAHATVTQEISTAADHAGLAAKSTSVKVALFHLHHTLNCLVGPKGHGFDLKASNPCAGMGNGAIADSTSAKTKRTLERIAARTDAALRGKQLTKIQKDARMIEAELTRVK